MFLTWVVQPPTKDSLLGTNIIPSQGMFEDDFPFSEGGIMYPFPGGYG